jgi:hypothetical protein
VVNYKANQLTTGEEAFLASVTIGAAVARGVHDANKAKKQNQTT